MESRMVVTRCCGQGEGNGEMLVKEYKLPVIRKISSGDWICSIVTIVNDTVL